MGGLEVINICLNIIMLLVYIILISFSIQKRKLIDINNQLEFTTKVDKVYVKISSVFLALSVLLHLLSIILFVFNVKQASWVVFGFATFFGLMTTLMFIDLFLDYEAIDNDYLYVHRFLKTKKINIYEIKYVVSSGFILFFYDKNGKFLFILDAGTKGCYMLLDMIKDMQKKVNQSIIMCGNNYASYKTKDLSLNSNEIYKEIGKDYKQSLPKKIKITIFIMIFSALLTLISCTIWYKTSQNDSVPLLCIISILCVIIYGTNYLSLYKKEKNVSNLNLGKKYYFKNKNVIGSAIKKHTVKKVSSIVISIMSIVMSLTFSLAIIFENDVKKDDLISVNGTVEYVSYEKVNKSYNIIIGIEGTLVEYRVSSISLMEIERKDFLNEVEKGDRIYLSINKNLKDANGVVDKNKKQWSYVYEISTDTKTYLTFENYLANDKKDDNFGFGISLVFAMAALIAVGYGFTINKGIKDKLSKEYINVYE